MASKNRQKDLAKELEADFRRWDYLMENGGTDPFYPDGSNLNMVRRQIAIVKEKCEEQLNIRRECKKIGGVRHKFCSLCPKTKQNGTIARIRLFLRWVLW